MAEFYEGKWVGGATIATDGVVKPKPPSQGFTSYVDKWARYSEIYDKSSEKDLVILSY